MLGAGMLGLGVAQSGPAALRLLGLLNAPEEEGGLGEGSIGTLVVCQAMGESLQLDGGTGATAGGF